MAAGSSGGGAVGLVWWLLKSFASAAEVHPFAEVAEALSHCPTLPTVLDTEVHLPSLACGIALGILLGPLLDLLLLLRLRWRSFLRRASQGTSPQPLYRLLE